MPDEFLAALETAVSTTLKAQQIPAPCEITLLLTGDADIQQLNRDFRRMNKPTDVLSFAAGENWPEMGADSSYLGDIAISVQTAERQAAANGHTLLAELQLLAVHGALHLLGFDHGDPEEKAAMWAAQTAVLSQLGLENVTPTEI